MPQAVSLDTGTLSRRRIFLTAAVAASGTLAPISTAPAQPAAPGPRAVLEAYDEWLFRERRRVHAVLWPGHDPRETTRFVSVSSLPDDANPAEGVADRAAAVLTAAGVNIAEL